MPANGRWDLIRRLKVNHNERSERGQTHATSPTALLVSPPHPVVTVGVGGGTVGSGTALQAGRSRVRFPTVSREFFIDSPSNRNEY